MIDDNILTLLLSLAVSAALTGLFVRRAALFGLVDQPDERKVHTTPIPKGGGLAIFAGLLVALFFQPYGPPTEFWLACLGIVVLGLLDDLYQLPWWSRLPVHIGLALWMTGCPHPSGWTFTAAAVVWIVGLVNAFNMIDNMDAQSAGTAWIGAVALAFVLLVDTSLPAYLAFIGAVTGFLFFNWPPARIFMGDAGSTLLGFFLAVRTLHDGFLATWEREVATLAILALPWYDLITVVLIRLGQGKSPFHPDKQHLAHRLTDQGLSRPAAVRVLHLLAMTSAALGVGMLLAEEEFLIFAGMAAFLWFNVACFDTLFRQRRIKKHSAANQILPES